MQNLRFGILPYYIPFKYRLKTNIWLQSTNLLNLHQFTSTYFITQMLCMCVCVCAAMIVWLHKKLTLIKSYNELLCWFINLGNHPKKPHSLFTSNKWFNLKSTNNVFLLVFFSSPSRTNIGAWNSIWMTFRLQKSRICRDLSFTSSLMYT